MHGDQHLSYGGTWLPVHSQGVHRPLPTLQKHPAWAQRKYERESYRHFGVVNVASHSARRLVKRVRAPELSANFAPGFIRAVSREIALFANIYSSETFCYHARKSRRSECNNAVDKYIAVASKKLYM